MSTKKQLERLLHPHKNRLAYHRHYQSLRCLSASFQRPPACPTFATYRNETAVFLLQTRSGHRINHAIRRNSLVKSTSLVLFLLSRLLVKTHGDMLIATDGTLATQEQYISFKSGGRATPLAHLDSLKKQYLPETSGSLLIVRSKLRWSTTKQESKKPPTAKTTES